MGSHSGSGDNAAFFAGLGPCLIRYEADPATATLTERQRLTFPLDIQYAWRHPARPLIYLALSNGGPGKRGDTHQIAACRINPDNGQASLFGTPAAVPWRPLHLSLDRENRHVLAAHNDPSGVSVVSLRDDGSPGELVPQRDDLEFGIFGHQILATPDGGSVILVCRGYDAEDGTPERPGDLRVFGYRNGHLTPRATIAPNGGFGFGARHIDFHPSLPILYLAVERQSELQVFDLADGSPAKGPKQSVSTIEDSTVKQARQAVSAIHVHPNGKTVYISNRAYGTVDTLLGATFLFGENSITAFSIDSETGLVSLLQHMPTRGNLPRTFSIDPSGRMLVAANSQAAPRVTAAGGLRDAPLSLVTFGISGDGRLRNTGKIDFPDRHVLLFWAGFL